MATCNGRIDVGRYAIEIKFVHIDRLADAIINQTLYCLSWYNNRLSTAVYNFMQTQKEWKPCKIKASAANKRSARRGSNPRPPPWQGGAPPLSHSRISYGQVIIYYRAPEMSIKKVCIFFVNCIYN